METTNENKMNLYIVTTTINSPTLATKRFAEIAEKRGFKMVVVGDLRTPHNEYFDLEQEYACFTYLHPEIQEKLYPELSETIGWKSIQRRNIGFVYAYQNGADIVATVDDDNIPYDDWGTNILVGKEVEIDLYDHQMSHLIFDPLSVTEHNNLWHRGYPIELVPEKNKIEYKGKVTREILVQADFWDGDPDIDAICRLSIRPTVKFNSFDPFGCSGVAPFNSQNTFIARKALPKYSVLPHVGRMDDIWASYILQYYFPQSVVYSKASVYQARNPQDLVTNLENEVLGYRQTLNLVTSLDSYENFLPEATQKFWKVYQQHFI